MVPLEAVEELSLARPGELALDPGREVEIRRRVAATDLRSVGRAGELLGRVLADGDEHDEARLAGDLPLPEKTLVDQTGQAIQDVAAADGLDLRKPRATSEHREPTKQRACRRVEEVVAPADRPAQRALAVREIARARREEIERVAEPLQDRFRWKDLHARGRELDRERKAIEA